MINILTTFRMRFSLFHWPCNGPCKGSFDEFVEKYIDDKIENGEWPMQNVQFMFYIINQEPLLTKGPEKCKSQEAWENETKPRGFLVKIITIIGDNARVYQVVVTQKIVAIPGKGPLTNCFCHRAW
jgi:hypothetical protein